MTSDLCRTALRRGAAGEEPETFVDIALFGVKKRELLRRFLPFSKGTTAHDHLGDLLATLDAECFQRCFAAWVASFTGLSEEVIAIDGKTSRRAKQGGKTLLHTVSAFCARQRLVLGQTKVMKSRPLRSS
ncbi:ISAs1 family transposase [Ventosimonas gracilis]|uniref:ISAs1 family transposase n=1 Tax=Ventosimonas gracilis TaxID=1680762 RepID=UPI0023BA9411|nr:ISAs1 family transposase [Ventosimonas gracilis]